MDIRPRTSFISFCTVQLRTLCAAHSLATLCLSTTSGSDPGELLGFWCSLVFRHASVSRKGSGKQQQQQEFLTYFVPRSQDVQLLEDMRRIQRDTKERVSLLSKIADEMEQDLALLADFTENVSSRRPKGTFVSSTINTYWEIEFVCL